MPSSRTSAGGARRGGPFQYWATCVLVASLGLGSCSDESLSLADIFMPDPPGPTPTPSPLPLNNSHITLAVGDHQDLISLLSTRENWDPAKLTWRSSNEAVVTVDTATGRIQAVGPGAALVTVVARGGVERTANISVQVNPVRLVQSVTVTPTQLQLNVGEQQTLSATVRLTNRQLNSNITWSSSDDTLAVVNPTNGQVTALKPGAVTIVAAYTPDPQHRAVAYLTINDPVADAPMPAGRWEQLRRGGPDLSAVHFVDRTTGYACGLQGTLLMTTDAGQTWQDVASPAMADDHLTALSFVGRQLGWVTGQKGSVYRTEDGGATWEVLRVFPENQSPAPLRQVHFVDALTGYVGNDDAVPFMTSDGGQSWDPLPVPTNAVPPLRSMAGFGPHLWTIANTPSTEGARSQRYAPDTGWVQGGTLDGLRPSGFKLIMHSATEGWCVVFNESGGGLRRTRDGGNTWEGTGLMETATKPLKLSLKWFRDLHFPDPQHGWLVFGAGDQMAVTADGGTTWRAITVPGLDGLNDIQMVDPRLGWAVGTGGTIIRYRSD